ncbi:MAG: AI-2E family transporter [Parcubacteria group bacterium]|nr:AI-2E family transporter [Parcubacteria group bacterium]
MDSNTHLTIHISTASIVKILVVLLSLWLLYQIKEIILILFAALILSAVLDPVVKWMVSKKIPKIAGLIGVYLLVVIFIGVMGSILIPSVIEQVKDMSGQIPANISRLASEGGGWAISFGGVEVAKRISDALQAIEKSLVEWTTTGLLPALFSIFGGILGVILVFVLSFYLLVQEDALKNAVKMIVPVQYQPSLVQFYKKVQEKIGLWSRGYLILALIVWFLSYLTLLVLNVKYALVLSLIMPITEIIPMSGPLIGMVVIVPLVFLQSPIQGLLALIILQIINLTESNILVPAVMQKAIGLNPVLIILSILVGVKLAGLVGAVLAIPGLIVASVLINQIFAPKEAKA